MNIRTALVSAILLLPFPLAAQQEWFRDDFERASLGSAWKETTGDWTIANGNVSITTKDYDRLLAGNYYTYNTESYTIEVRLRGLRAGVFFSLDDTSSKALSHMVRFDEKSILAGYFNGAGEFVATSIFESPRLPNEWTLLRIDVHPAGKRYEIFVEGLSVGVDEHLIFRSGYIGLQASEGTSSFNAIRLSSSSPPRKPAPPARKSRVSFDHVRFVRAGKENVVIYNPDLGLLQALDMDGHLLRQEPPGTVFDRMPPVRARDRTYSIIDRALLITHAAGKTDTIKTRLIAPSAVLADGDSAIYVADAGARAIHRFTPEGEYIGSFTAASIGGFIAPRGLDHQGKNNLIVADYSRLVIVPKSLLDPEPAILPIDSASVTISWPRLTNELPTLEYAGPDLGWKRVECTPSADGLSSSTTLSSLQPRTRYRFRLLTTLRTIPAGQVDPRVYRFATPPASPAMMSVARLPLLVMVYRTISYRDKYPATIYPQIPDGRRLSDDDIASLRTAVDFNRVFYFRNSGCKLSLDMDFAVIDDTLWLGQVGNEDPYWLSAGDRVAADYERTVMSLGRKLSDYAGLIVPYAWVNYPPRRTSALSDPSRSDTITIRQAYGGGTLGVPAPWRYGKTTGYTGNPFQDRFSRQDWLITHEFHHQLDALLDLSGYAGYYHADEPWKMPGRFGEDFDFNASILRNARPDWWENLAFGSLAETRDADRDGIPDADMTLPFDEQRLEGDTRARDSDGDGLDDLQEVMAGTSTGTSLRLPDTDGDGLNDRDDPQPLYPITPLIPHTGSPEAGRTFGTISAPQVQGSVSLSWSVSGLDVTCTTDSPVNLLLQIDANTDGWFHGFDNIQIRIEGTGDSTRVQDYYLRDCASWTDPPRDRKDILRVQDLRLTAMKPDTLRDSAASAPQSLSRYTLSCTVPGLADYGFSLRAGKKIGIRIGIQTSSDRWVWHEMFERNYMMVVELR